MEKLPIKWTIRIFEILSGTYGKQFIGTYSKIVNGVDIGTENALLIWSEELAEFKNEPDAIKIALTHLPEKAPNAIQFKELCKKSSNKRFKNNFSCNPKERNYGAGYQEFKKLANLIKENKFFKSDHLH